MTPERPGRRLQPPVLEPLHLEVEALAQAVGAADQVGVGHEPVLEGQLVGVHAPVAQCVDGATLQPSGPGAGGRSRLVVLGEHEAVPVAAWLLDDEHRDAAVGQGAVRVGAGQQHQHVGPGGEGAPRLDAVDEPAPLASAWPRSRCRRRRSRSRARSPPPRPAPRPRPVGAATASSAPRCRRRPGPG